MFSLLAAFFVVGIPQVQSVSIAKLWECIWIRKNPDSPQYEPHELRPTQYSVPFSIPYPTTLISWLIILEKAQKHRLAVDSSSVSLELVGNTNTTADRPAGSNFFVHGICTPDWSNTHTVGGVSPPFPFSLEGKLGILRSNPPLFLTSMRFLPLLIKTSAAHSCFKQATERKEHKLAPLAQLVCFA